MLSLCDVIYVVKLKIRKPVYHMPFVCSSGCLQSNHPYKKAPKIIVADIFLHFVQSGQGQMSMVNYKKIDG